MNDALRLNAKNKIARPLALVFALGLVGVACGGGTDKGATPGAGTGTDTDANLSGAVKVDGSSTVAPLMKLAAEDFQTAHKRVVVTVGTSGTGGGFEKFCAGETDIANASRPIKDTEVAKCKEKGVEYTELQVANDALTVVVNKSNTWAECLTIAQLKKIWEPAAQGAVTNWNQVDPKFPSQSLRLFGAGTDSGTFDYFTEAIVGKAKSSRTDYSPSEDDNVTVKGVEGEQGALGYFGLSYFEENAKQLKAVKVDAGDGKCVAGNSATVQDGTYKPLGRPLFVYVKKAASARPEVGAFLRYYAAESDRIIEEALFVPLTSGQKSKLTEAVKAIG